MEISASAIILVLFFVCLLLHIPIGFSLGICSMAAIITTDLVLLSFIAKTYVTSANPYTLLAVLFFTLASDLMPDG